MPQQLAHERRAVVRALCPPDACARVSRSLSDAPRWGRVVDASPYGLGLLLPAPFEEGTVLVVRLCRPGQRYLHPAVARVAHASALPDGTFRVGCSLMHRLPEEVLVGLTAEVA